jgi:hypothetical protein
VTVLPLLLAALATVPVPEVRAVRFTIIDHRAALRVLVSEDMPPGQIVREEAEVVIRLPGVAPENFPLPAVERPLEGLWVEREEGATVLRVNVAPDVPFEASAEPGMVTVVFGARPDPAERGAVTPELYALLFPAGVLVGAEEEREDEEEETYGGEREGLYFGRIHLQPYLTLSYVDADIQAFDNPQPVRTHYLEVVPGLTATSPLMTGRLAVELEPRFRFFSDIPEVNETAFFSGIRYEFPLGTRTLLRLGHRYVTAILETTVVDPGMEYFFGLSRYSFNNSTAGARITVGPSVTAEIDAGYRWSRFDQTEAVGFFDYDAFNVRAGLGYDLRSDLRAIVSYAYDHIPSPSDRPIAESTSHNLLATLNGQLTPLTSGEATVGVRRQTNPLGTSTSSTYTGLTLGGTLRRELGHSSNLGLRFQRTSTPSGFADNPYYVHNTVQASLDVPIPLGLWARGSVGYLWNRYPNVVPVIGEPRRDDIWAWMVGLGRQLGWRSWIRADYRREQRDSNVAGYDVTNDGFLIQFGIGRLGPGGAQ